MNEHSSIINRRFSFKSFLFKNKRNRTILWLAAIATVVQFAIFKYFYPFASYIHDDSFLYIDTAYQNLSINTYMIGYSMFLRLFSVFSTSDIALVVCQYFLLLGSTLFLLFTMFYFYPPRKAVQTTLLVFIIFNPLFLYLGNLVSSDALFAALSATWFALLIWIINRPSVKLIVWHTILIFLCFTVRYNALIYLFIAAIAFILSAQPLLRKIGGIGAAALFISIFVLYTGNAYKSLTGTWQYSPFSGWQLANNAMYAYRYVDSAKRITVPQQFQSLDKMICNYFDTTRDSEKFPIEKLQASTFYMWSRRLPLYKYRDNIVFKKDTQVSELKKWALMGSFYNKYGMYLISNYPGYFARYFLWPNTKKYYAPPVEYLGIYNSGKQSVAPIAQTWFRYKNSGLKTRAGDKNIYLLNFYPILSGVVNVVMLLGLFSFTLLDGFRQNIQLRKAVILGSTLWLLNAAFTIFASSVALRFQVFPILLSIVFGSLLLDWLLQIATEGKNIQSSNLEINQEHLSLDLSSPIAD